MINAKHGSSIFAKDPVYNYDNLLRIAEYKKTKNISIISSSKGFTEFHKARYQFALKVKDHFKDKIDLYGQGHNPIPTKVEAIIPYKFHIAIENQATNNVITEKLYDSYLGLSYPIYCGNPNIANFFDTKSLKQINIYDLKTSLLTIEEVLSCDGLYEASLPHLIEAKRLVLEKYNPFLRMTDIAKCLDSSKPVKVFKVGNRKSFKKKRWYNKIFN